MDYLLFPRNLIYKERRSLEEFAEHTEEITFVIDNMLDNYNFSSANGKERALSCLNTAYYLCTVILKTESHPEWNFAKYCDIACCGNSKDSISKVFTLSLVYLLLTHVYYEVPCKKLLKKLEKYLNDHYLVSDDPFQNDFRYSDAYNDLMSDAPEEFYIAEDFESRAINRGVLTELKVPFGFWAKLTNNYDKDEVKKMAETLGRDEDEEHMMVEIIRRDAQRNPEISSDYFFETLKPLFDSLDSFIFWQYNDIPDFDDVDKWNEALEEEEDIANLNARLKEPDPPVPQSEPLTGASAADIESLNRQLAEEKDRNAQLADEVKQLREALELDQLLSQDQQLQIDERIILVTTALGLPWQSDLTNQTQLAHIIRQFSGDGHASIRSRIVAINKEMKKEMNHPGEGLSQGTKEAINNVIGWLGKATRGDRNTQATDKLIQEIKDVFLNAKE